jgi:general secretion pathway protein D
MAVWKRLFLTTACAALSVCLDLAAAEEPARLWNFHDADIRAVTQVVSELTQKTIILSPNVSGQVTLVSQTPMTIDQLYSSYLSMLQQLNLAAVPTADNTLKIVPAAEAIEYASVDANTNEGNIVLRVIQVHNASSASLVSVIRPLLHKWGYVTAYAPSNTLIVSGTKDNLDRIEAIVREMDNTDSYQVRIIKLRYASAKKIETILTAMQMQDGRVGKPSTFSVTADEGSNSVLISGDSTLQAKIKNLIQSLDNSQSQGQTDTAVIRLNYLDAKTFAPILENTGKSTQKEQDKKQTEAGEISVQAELDNNALVIHAPNALMNTLKAVVKKLDRRPQQVLIEAVIVNMNQSTGKNLGIDWGINLTPVTASIGSATFGIIRSGSIDTVISALKTDGDSNILATPAIMVLNNKEAKISSGENIALSDGNLTTAGATSDSTSPYYQNGVYNSVERKDVTLSLKVTPHIAPNDTVRMHIDHQDDSLPNEGSDKTADNLNQSYLTNTISTDVIVNSGDILVLGGLGQDSVSKTLSKVPFLADIPGVGKLFQHLDKEMKRKNLMIFIKPVIVNDAHRGQQLTRDRYIQARAQELNMKAGVKLDPNAANTELPSWQSQVGRMEEKDLHLPAPQSTRYSRYEP